MRSLNHTGAPAILRKSVVALLLLLCPLVASAQVMDNSRQVDTLKFAERLSVRTNLVDWGLFVPNVGVEFDIRNTNWNRWSVGANVRFRPKAQNTFVPGIVYDIFSASLEGRVYWRERTAQSKGYLMPHRLWWDKLWSCRNMMPSHPNWIFYRGGYVSYADYNMKFGGPEGWKGHAYLAGVTWGFVKPFVAFMNGNSLDMEFGISGGLMLNTYDKYRTDREANLQVPVSSTKNKLGLMLKDVHVAVVYRFGKYPLQKKYRWRYDVDLAYRERRDSMYSAWLTAREQKYIRDSIYKVVAADFKALYDSCVDERHLAEQTAINVSAPERIVNMTPKQRDKFMRDQLKDEKKARRDSLVRARRDSLIANDPRRAARLKREAMRDSLAIVNKAKAAERKAKKEEEAIIKHKEKMADKRAKRLGLEPPSKDPEKIAEKQAKAAKEQATRAADDAKRAAADEQKRRVTREQRDAVRQERIARAKDRVAKAKERAAKAKAEAKEAKAKAKAQEAE